MRLADIEYHFKCAVYCDLAGQILHHNAVDPSTPDHNDLLFPSMSNDALAIELYIKCIFRLEGYTNTSKKHGLKFLFSCISPKARIEITEIYNKEVRPMIQDIIDATNKYGKPETFELKDLINKGSDTFETVRYLYEPGQFHKKMFLFGMPIKLAFRRYILKLHPEWNKYKVKRMVW
jgi:hypothetical protein